MSTPPPNPSYTLQTQAWLDARFAAGGAYHAHEPIFGYGDARSAPDHAQYLARTARLLALLAGEPFADFLDVGGGEGYMADWVRETFGVPAAACDLSREACRRGRELFGVPTFAANAARLPLPDAAFDCVLCAEVIEHLENPFEALAELMRVTRRLLIVTSLETLHLRVERSLRLKLRRLDRPHTELNWWHPDDFTRLMGTGATFERQMRRDDIPSDTERDVERVKAWLRHAIDPAGLNREGFGGLVLWRPPEPPRETPPLSGAQTSFNLESLWDRLLAPRPLGRAVTESEERWLRSKLRSPLAGGELIFDGAGVADTAAGRRWPSREGLIDLTILPAEAPRPSSPLDAATVRRLRRLFARRNVWRGPRRALASLALAFVEVARDLRVRRTPRRVLGNFLHATRGPRRAISPRRQGWLVRARGQDAIYRIDRGRRRHITSAGVFLEMGFDFDEVREVDPAFLDRYPLGSPITERE